jgi:hypothetical protein
VADLKRRREPVEFYFTVGSPKDRQLDTARRVVLRYLDCKQQAMAKQASARQ